MAMSGLDLIYENMKSWQEKFPNLKCLSIFLFEDQMRVRIDWHDAQYTYVIPQTALNEQDLDKFGEMILSEAERQYRILTVGEE